MHRKYKRNFLKNLKRLSNRKNYANKMREVHAEYPIPRGHAIRKLFSHLHIGSING